jgi:hypothetical protein
MMESSIRAMRRDIAAQEMSMHKWSVFHGVE